MMSWHFVSEETFSQCQVIMLNCDLWQHHETLKVKTYQDVAVLVHSGFSMRCWEEETVRQRALDQGSISEIGENGECHLGNF